MPEGGYRTQPRVEWREDKKNYGQFSSRRGKESLRLRSKARRLTYFGKPRHFTQTPEHRKPGRLGVYSAAKSALKPSTIVGWESTASRSAVAGIFATITACTVPIISPASAARI